MKLMTSEEIAELQKEFDEYVDRQLLFWAARTLVSIKNLIKAKNTGSENSFEGKIQVDWCMFYLSEELSSKISESKKSFHKGNDIFTNLLDKFFESCSDYNFGGHFNLYNSAFLDECNLGMVKELPPDFRKPLRYFACFGISLLRNTIEVQKGILFKRMVKKDEWKWKFSGISLEFLKKLEALCNESNIKILGAEIVFFNKSISEYTPQVHTMENLYDSYVCKDPMGASNRATFLKWRYSTNG